MWAGLSVKNRTLALHCSASERQYSGVSYTYYMRPTLPAAVVAAIASACIGSNALHRRAIRSHGLVQLRQWSDALELVKAFGDSSGLSTEISSTVGLGTLPLRNMALLSAVQDAGVDRREASAMKLPLSRQASEVMTETSLEDAARIMRFASASYGSALMVMYGLIPAAPPVDFEQLGSKRSVTELIWDSRSAICFHTGCAPSDLIRVETESLDVAGSADCLRHFIAIERAGSGAVVLSLRGTASISDVLHDAIACAPAGAPLRTLWRAHAC